ncbi:MAG: exodeoxyribonuclease I [Xanthomonadaceae bacterium]|nr:exodeoxyribonuclease I [Xanthomonadaceae bacterium]
MQQPSLYWHDYETFGADPRRDRPAQFAGLRTDLDLDPIGSPVSFFCQPASDVLPHPDACLLTGITPQQAAREGVPEPEFAARVHQQLAAPGTCGVGWNSIRFDDEFTRQLLYRNFHDPYLREWKNGNSRWDLIDLARMAYALRPQGMEWPRREDGAPSFRLEHLARANGSEPRRAHDALSDVESLLGLARRLKTAQPRLWNWHYTLRNKRTVLGLLDPARMTPLLHVSQRYPAERGCLAVVVPIAAHPTQPNAVIVADLDPDPETWSGLGADALADRLFTARADLPEGIERAPLKLVHANRSPALAPLSALKRVDRARIGLDLDRALEHAEQLRGVAGLAERVRELYARDLHPAAADPELALYAGFLDDRDRPQRDAVRSAPPQALAALAAGFHDPRYHELLFRYRARHYPDTLDDAERRRWEDFRHARLTRATPLTTLTLDDYFALIAARRAMPEPGPAAPSVLDQLEVWGRQLAASIAA